MKSRTFTLLAVAALLLAPQAVLAAGPEDTPGQGHAGSHGRTVGAVYTMTNAGEANEVLVFHRRADGSLLPAGTYDTGGLGSPGALGGNQGGVVLSADGRWLLVVDSGSDEISLFSVHRHGLRLRDTAPSGGVLPISVAVHGNLVFVVNAGDDSIAGFRIRRNGRLSPLVGSSHSLSGVGTAPAQIGFSPNGRFVLVTEKATNSIDVFRLNGHGGVVDMVQNASAGVTPFAFAFGKRGQLFVSEVFGGGEDAGAVSSYQLRPDGTLRVISASVANTETAPCWLVATLGGRYVYTTNTPDDSLSAYATDFGGHLELLDADGRSGEPGPGTKPLDMDLSDGDRFLYTLNIGNNRISTFGVGLDGSLTLLWDGPGVPAGANGLAAR
ncbi:MAG: lactonase family protein [Acidobacteria bacterium]|nr:lactonase family protein [Acidobacteriota bacterium]